ncbi:fimbrial protein [Pseudomonas lactis]|uniref:Fimbrial protein n=1 Tax=Pseudomonas lactis TaxID=1615674 RepID=I4K8U0_9PSED|nr:fimbrial protein [Pseudomonas lactis]EIK61130.1 fimbrial protein [Pseudomonas lactis]
MNRTLFVVAALTSAFAMSAAHAADGTINFSGELTAQTCTTKLNGGTSTTVTLPKLSTSALATIGAVAGSTGFTIELSGCSGTMATAAAYFESGAGVDPVTKNVRNVAGTGPAGGVQLQLLDYKSVAIKAGDTAQRTLTARNTITSGATAITVLPYAVQYYATGTSTPGLVSGSVTYSIDYQ